MSSDHDAHQTTESDMQPEYRFDYREARPNRFAARQVLRLASGLCLTDPVTMLQKKFEEWRWEKYDGVPVVDPQRITPADVERVYQLGARSSREAYTSLLETRGDEIASCLNRIPLDLNLEDDDEKVARARASIIALMDIVTAQKSIKLAGATKLLSPFRPGLIPVIDSVVENYYWFALSISSEAEFRVLQAKYQESWGEYVWQLLKLMRRDLIGAAAEIDAVRRAFANTPIAGVARIRVLESLIWYYYARGQTSGDPE